MKVAAYVQPSRTIGQVTGVGKFIAGGPAALSTCGHDVRLFAAHDEIVDGSPLAALPLTVLPYRRRTIEWGGAIFGRPQINIEADWLWCPAESFVATRGAHLAITAHTSDWAESDLPWSGEWRYRRLRARWNWFYDAVRRSGARVLAVSEFLMRRLIERIDIPGDRIRVVGHGVDEPYFKATLQDPLVGIPGFSSYILVTGGLTPYKGGDRALAVAELMPEVHFVVVGDYQYCKSGSGYPNIYRCGYRNVNAGLPALYARAAAVLVLSRYETFGLPAAEAMAAGVPVIVSDAGALPEVVGDAGFVVKDGDPTAVVGILNDLHRDIAGRSQVIERGRERAESFRWERTGQRIAAALETSS